MVGMLHLPTPLQPVLEQLLPSRATTTNGPGVMEQQQTLMQVQARQVIGMSI